MKKILPLLLIVNGWMGFAQTAPSTGSTTIEKPQVKWGGYVNLDVYHDNRMSVDSREGEIYFFPKPIDLDSAGVDKNEVNQFGMSEIQSRLTSSITGPTVLNAKASAYIEVDFIGTSNDARLFILRQAFINFQWNKTELLFGSTWHPMCNTDVFPNTVAYGAGIPFRGLNRSPQIRFIAKPIEPLKITLALLTPGAHKSKGEATAARNSGIPEVQGQVKYNYKNIVLVGFGGGMQSYRPMISQTVGTGVSAKTYVNDNILACYNMQGVLKVSLNKFTFKAEATYGDNLTYLNMIGGFGIDGDYTNAQGISNYTPLKTLSSWIDFDYALNKFNFGLMGGYAENQGSQSKYIAYANSVGMYDNIDNIYRISPRIYYTIGHISTGIEYMRTAAVYGVTFDEKRNVTSSADAVFNDRIQLQVRYTF